MSRTESGEIRRLVERGKNNTEAQQVEQYQTCIAPIKQVTEEHVAQGEEDQEKSEKEVKLLIKYDNIEIKNKKDIWKNWLN